MIKSTTATSKETCSTSNSSVPNTNPTIVSEKLQKEFKVLNDQLEFTRKDRDSYKHSYELILEDHKAADRKIWELTKQLHEKDTVVKVQGVELRKNAELINQMNLKITELTNKHCEVHGKWEAGNLANEILGMQLDSYMADKRDLEKKLEMVLARLPTPTATNSNQHNTSKMNGKVPDPASTPTEKVERCTILHDSLMNRVNDSLLRREGVSASKTWAPDFKSMLQELDKMKPTETVVLQALTRDITKMDVNAFNRKIDQTVAKAKEKAKKIVLPTIVYREDVNQLWRSIDLVNAYIHYTYGDDENVIICDNSKLLTMLFDILTNCTFQMLGHLY